MKARKVINLATGEERVYVGLNASQAVIAAYAQSKGDYNTWDYGQHKYPVQFGKVSVTCGDWATKL